MIITTDVEVPAYGTVVVQQGDVQDVQEFAPTYEPCWCTDGRHVRHERQHQQEHAPHLVGVQQFEMTWEVK